MNSNRSRCEILNQETCKWEGKGHRSASNGAFLDHFGDWIENAGLKPNSLKGALQIDPFEGGDTTASCALARCREAEGGERLKDGPA